MKRGSGGFLTRCGLRAHDQAQDRNMATQLISVDEFMADVRTKVVKCGVMASHAIPEPYPLLRTLQLSHVGYYRVI